MIRFLGTLLLLVPASAPPASAQATDFETLLEQLVDSTRNAPAWRELVRSGEAAALAALDGYAEQDLEARQWRSLILRQVGSEACVEAVLGLVEREVDSRARAAFVDWLGRRELQGFGERRTAVLERLAAGDPDDDVRRLAVEGLAGIDHPAAAQALEALLDVLPQREATRAAEVWADLSSSRPALVRRVQAAFGERPLAAPVLAALLSPYGRALAELPGGGTAAAERAPLVIALRHPAPIVRSAALDALDAFTQRSGALYRDEQARAFLGALAAEGVSEREMNYRLAQLALLAGADFESGVAAARALVRSVPLDAGVGERIWAFYGHYLEAAAFVSGGRPEEAAAPLRRAGEVLDGLRAEEVQWRPHVDRPSGAHVAAAVEYTLLRSMVEVMEIARGLQAGTSAEDAALRASALRAHRLALEAHVLRTLHRAPIGADQWDDVLNRPLAPERLVFRNAERAGGGLRDSLRLLEDLGRVLSAVAPLELPGFEPAGPVADPITDDRRDLLVQVLEARLIALEERLRERVTRSESADLRTDPVYRDLLLQQQQALTELEDVRDGTSDRPLKTQRLPSRWGLTLVREWLDIGQAARARALGERMLRDLEEAEIWEPFFWKARLAARLESAVASSYTDENRPERAEELLLRALGRHEELESTFRRRQEELIDEPARAAALAAQVEQTRRDQADVLVSLAVNANVRLRAPDRALEFFERAYALNQNDFMRVLLACYRARSGQADQARSLLREIVVTPSLYYNLACTHALMGETEPALDYLAREFAENHPDAASLARQKEWAAGDPDLASLADDPRFQRLIAQ